MHYMVGKPLSDIETPALVLDADLLEHNIEKMAAFARNQGVNLRPHAKTHKCAMLAHLQIKAGAIGITCAKLSEAEAMAHAGIRDILIANQVVAPEKIERLVGLSRYSDVKVAVDNPDNARTISEAAQRRGQVIKVLIERDIGMGRCGTRNLEETLRLADMIVKLPGLEMAGLMGYEGHTVFLTPFREKEEQCLKAIGVLVETKEALNSAGFKTEIVSSGGTGTYNITGLNKNITELQVGSYSTMDLKYREVGLDFHLALTVLGTVISRPDRQTVILDVGMKGITREFGLPVAKGLEGATVRALPEEHCILELSAGNTSPAVGDRVELYPTHGCTTFNLYDNIHVCRGGIVEAVWPVTARGAMH